MSNPVIKVENLGKLYKIGARQERYLTLRDQIANAFTAPFRGLRKGVRCQVSGVRGDGDGSPNSAIHSPQSEIDSPAHPLIRSNGT